MAKSVEIGLRDIPSIVRNKLFRRRGQTPDMELRVGPIDTVVVLYEHVDAISVYHRSGKKGERKVTRVLTETTRDAAIDAVLREVFRADSKEKSGTVSFKTYGGK